jgi:peptidoglycan hydrolase CwlO-like protein
MAEKLDRLEAQLEEIGGRLDKLRERMRDDRKWEHEDLEQMLKETFDDIGRRLDHLISRM